MIRLCVLFFCFSTLIYAAPLVSYADGVEIANGCDDCCSDTFNTDPFPLFGKATSQWVVSANGIVTGESCVSSYTSSPFPTNRGVPILAVYWGDAHHSASGEVFYSANTGDSPITRPDFTADRWFTVTYVDAGYFSSRSDRTNTFQMSLASDGTETFICFRYPDGNERPTEGGLDWSTGNASGGVDGLGGTPSQVGLDAGDEINFFSLPESQTDAIRSIDGEVGINVPAEPASAVTNTGVTGEFCYQVSELNFAGGGGDPHIYTFHGEQFMLLKGMFNFFSHKDMVINAAVEPEKKLLFIVEMGILLRVGKHFHRLSGFFNETGVQFQLDGIDIHDGDALLGGRIKLFGEPSNIKTPMKWLIKKELRISFHSGLTVVISAGTHSYMKFFNFHVTSFEMDKYEPRFPGMLQVPELSRHVINEYLTEEKSATFHIPHIFHSFEHFDSLQ